MSKLKPAIDYLNGLAAEFGIMLIALLIGYLRRRLRRRAVEGLMVETLTKESEMEKNIGLGKEAGLKIELVDGKLKLAVTLDTAGVDAELAVLVEPQYFADKLKAAIGGQVDDVIIDILMGALKKA